MIVEVAAWVTKLSPNGDIEWERAIEAIHSFPKKLLKLKDNHFEKSYVLVNPNNQFTIDKSWTKSKVGWSAYESRNFFGDPKYVIKNGKLILVKK